MNQLKKNKEEKKVVVEPFQSFPILSNGQLIPSAMNYPDLN